MLIEETSRKFFCDSTERKNKKDEEDNPIPSYPSLFKLYRRYPPGVDVSICVYKLVARDCPRSIGEFELISVMHLRIRAGY